MSEINIVYGPNKYQFDSFLDEYLAETPSSFKIERYDLTTKESNLKDFLDPFSSFNLFSPQRLFIVMTKAEDILNLANTCLNMCDANKRVAFYCPDLYVKKTKNSYKSKTTKTKKSSTKSSFSVEDTITQLKELESVNLIVSEYLQDYDDAWEFCTSLIKSMDLNFDTKEDMELTIEHLLSCSQLTCDSKGELHYINSDTAPEEILYEQNLIRNNLNTVLVYNSNRDKIKFNDIEGLLFSIVNRTQTKQFMKSLFKCKSTRQAAKLLQSELSQLNQQEIRTFISFFRNTLEQNLKMVYGESYTRGLVSPIRQGNLNISKPEEAFDDICDILSDYTCSCETYINKLKLCLYNNFSS